MNSVELRAEKGERTSEANKRASSAGVIGQWKGAGNVCLKKTVYTDDLARGSRLADESANTVCHHDLEHKRHVFCKLKLFANATKTDGTMKIN